MRTLILGQIPDNFSFETHIPLGPFCFLGKEHIVPNWEECDYQEDTFADSNELKRADELTCRYTNQTVQSLAEEYNRLWGLSYSNKFWKVVLFPWLCLLIQSSYERQLRIKKVVGKYLDEPIEVELLKDEYQWKFNNMVELWNDVITSTTFNEWLFSRIIEKCAPNNWKLSYKDGPEGGTHKTVSKTNLLKSKIRTINNKFKTCVLDRYYHVYGIGTLQAFKINQILKNKKIDLNAEEKEKTKEATVDIHWIYDIRELIDRVMPESVKQLPQRIKRSNNKFQKGRVYLGSQQLFHNEELKLKCALALENGEHIIGVQHGGHGYGTGKIAGHNNEVEYKQLAYITWGWDQIEDFKHNFKALPSPFLSQFIDKHENMNNKCILVGMPEFAYLFRYTPTPQPKQFVKNRINTIDLLKNLDEGVRDNFAYRPPIKMNGAFDTLKYLSSKMPQIKVIDQNFHKELMQSKLLVMDNPSTTLNMAMVANIPLILFWRKDSYPVCRQAQILFDEIHNIGILHYCGENAAKKINHIWENVEDWWNQDNIQAVRHEYIQKYALAKKDWFNDWNKYLKSI